MCFSVKMSATTAVGSGPKAGRARGSVHLLATGAIDADFQDVQ